MANKEVGDLNAATTVGLSDLFLVSQSGSAKKVTTENLRKGFGVGTDITSNADLNDYVEVGTYAIKSNAIAQTLSNKPCSTAGSLFVKDGMASSNTPASYDCYRLQIYVEYPGTKFYTRCLSKTGGSSTWNVGSWYTFAGTAQT